MKILLCFGLLIPITLQASSNSVEITLSTNGKIGTKMILVKEGKKFVCSTTHVPVHEIQPRGLMSLEAPFKNVYVISPDCFSSIVWGKAKKCYRFGENRLVDELIRWCTN